MKWFKDDKEVVLDNRIQAVADGFIHQLQIADCRLEDKGRYKCVMIKHNNVETAANLTIEGK